jgi:hypothetical protein
MLAGIVANVDMMAARSSTEAKAYRRYWTDRVQSEEFMCALQSVLEEEFRALAGQKVGDLVDADAVAELIRRWDRTVSQRVVAEMVVEVSRLLAQELSEKKTSVRGLLDSRIAGDLDAILERKIVLSERAEDFISGLMQREFVQTLFTDIIHTSIVAFYKRVNPLFGAVATSMLEDQIKGFIRLFMPMVQRQATAFVIDEKNRALFSEFSRSITRELMREPLPDLTVFLSTGRSKRAEALVKKFVASSKMRALVRDMTLAVWDGVYHRLQKRKLGDVLMLDKQAGWFAERGVEMILPALSRPHLRQFVEKELQLAAQQPGASRRP